MTSLISAFWTLLELCFLCLFWHCLFQPKVSNKKYCLVLLAVFLLFQTYMNIGLNQLIKMILTTSIYLTASVILNRGKWYQHLVFVLLGTGITGFFDTAFLYGASAILGISLSDLVWKKLLYVTVVTLGKLIPIFLAWLFLHFRKIRNLQTIEGKWLLLSILFPVASHAMLFTVYRNYQNQADISEGVVFFSMLLVVANVAILYLISLIEKNTAEQKEKALLTQQMELQTEHILALEKSYRSQRKITHEFRNQLQTIADLLNMDKIDAARDYVRELQGTQTTRIFRANSGHAVIDAVLNHKSQLAAENGIDMNINLNDLSGINIGMDRMIVLLSNLLDNAIEACCRKESDRQIFCEIIANDTLWISVKNTSNPVKISNGTVPTSKEQREEHGYGLPRIQSILDQLGAEYAFDYKDGWFTFVAEIPL